MVLCLNCCCLRRFWFRWFVVLALVCGVELLFVYLCLVSLTFVVCLLGDLVGFDVCLICGFSCGVLLVWYCWFLLVICSLLFVLCLFCTCCCLFLFYLITIACCLVVLLFLVFWLDLVCFNCCLGVWVFCVSGFLLRFDVFGFRFAG